MTKKNNKSISHTKAEQARLEVAGSYQDKKYFSIETEIEQLEAIIDNYKILNKKIHSNKNKISDLQKKTIRIKENKQRVEDKINDNERDDVVSPVSHTIDSSNLMKEIVDNKYLIKNKTCQTIKRHVEKIQNHITSDTKKSASYIEPLYLSCKLLKTHILYTQALENTVEAFDIQRELELQQDDANELIALLVDHFNSIKNYQPLEVISSVDESIELTGLLNNNNQAPLK